MNSHPHQRDFDNRKELVECLSRAIEKDGVEEPINGLRLARASSPTERLYGVSRPSLCIIAQGAKEIYLGNSAYRYDSERYLVATVELPITGKVVEASAKEPYLSLRIDLDPALIGSVMVESGLPSPSGQADAKAVFVSPLHSNILDAVVRVTRLIESPEEAKVLLPLVKREIVFRLLMSEQGDRLRHLPLLGGNSHRIAKAVERLRKEFNLPLSIEGLARDLGMSSSGFHHHFKNVMDMSPLQFQKLIRLQQARQLMLGESLDAASAGYQVGYDDPSHFSRDYKKHFGNSPIRDVERLKSMAIAE